MASNKLGLTAFRGKDGQELWKKYEEGRGFRGHPESVWDKVIVWNNWVIDQRGPGKAYDLETGKDMIRKHPITGQDIPWEFTKSGHHCNYAIANPHLLTFRADSAGFCDISTGETSRLTGFRSGCRNSLIPANGILNAPNFAHGCVCGYSLFTSLAFRHIPESDQWSYSALTLAKELKEEQVDRIGINLGAPGDRVAENGTLWVDFPSRGGSSPALDVKLEGENLEWYRKHSSLVRGDDLKWVASSGVKGLRSITIPLRGQKLEQQKSYLVRLVFAEPDHQETGLRKFHVTLQGKRVLADFDILRSATAADQATIREFHHIMADDQLRIEFEGAIDRPLLSGVEIIAESTEAD